MNLRFQTEEYIFATMRICSAIVVFLFMVFLSAPTVVTLVNKKADVSLCFNFSEEEHIHKQLTPPLELLSEAAHSNYDEVKHSFPAGSLDFELLSRSIFLPPPNLV